MVMLLNCALSNANDDLVTTAGFNDHLLEELLKHHSSSKRSEEAENMKIETINRASKARIVP